MSQQNRKGLIHILSFIVVTVVLIVLISLLFEGTSHFEIKCQALREETVPIDVLCIGGSSTYVYWSPMIAFQKYGFTSFDLSDDALSPALTLSLLKESRKMCNPSLYVIDIRCFENIERDPETYNYGYFTLYADGIPYSINRCREIEYAYHYASFEASRIQLHWKLQRNHDLLLWLQMKMGKFNNIHKIDKGQYTAKREYRAVELNSYSNVSKRAELKPETVEVLQDLISYINRENLNVLFIINAYSFTGEEMRATYNSIQDIIENSGIPCLDTNLYYNEIGLDGSTDFYNMNHVNALGTEKYTNWVGEWIKKNYKLEDHRLDNKYEIWNKQAITFNKTWNDLKDYYIQLIEKERDSIE